MQLFETYNGMLLIEQLMIITVILAAIASLVYAWWLRKGVLALPKGTEQMQKVWNGIREGALSYLRRQLRTIIPILA
ncbi:MAG: sodium/proton-translocating pyrophosphatase, partial [Promethearchaeota archaeon]